MEFQSIGNGMQIGSQQCDIMSSQVLDTYSHDECHVDFSFSLRK